MPAVGEIKTNPNNPQQRAKWDGSQWVDASVSAGGGGVPAGATARPDYGAGVYQSSDGAILARGSKGGLQMLQGAQTATGDAKTRINLGLDPAIAAQEQMAASEGRGGRAPVNPLNRDWGASLLVGREDQGKFMDVVGRAWGGQDFQDYQQASKSFESSIIPIFSGAAVTPSEAQRFIKASLPELGDTPQTLQAKARNRAMIMNAAARLTGQPKPFPDVPTWQERQLFGSSGSPRPAGRQPATPRNPNVPGRARAAYDARVQGGKIDTSKPRGDAANPFLAVDMATANRLPKGSHVILPDGSFGVVE